MGCGHNSCWSVKGWDGVIRLLWHVIMHWVSWFNQGVVKSWWGAHKGGARFRVDDDWRIDEVIRW